MRRNIAASMISFLLIVGVLAAVQIGPRPVRATAGSGVTDPSNQWAPYGPDPSIQNLVFHEYGGDAAERNGFVAGEIDVMDVGQTGIGIPVSQYAAYGANPDWLITPRQSSSIFYGIYFNYGSSTWARWGCDWAHGNSACGIEIRQAFAHLIDKARTISDGPLQGAGTPIADDLPASKINPNGTIIGTPAGSQCKWDTITADVSYCIDHGRTAFDLAPDPGGTPSIGSLDWCAAVEHLLRASQDSITSGGTTSGTLQLNADPTAGTSITGDHCGIDPNSPSLHDPAPVGVGQIGGPNKMRAFIRHTEPRLSLGLHLLTVMNTIFHVLAANTQIGSGGIIGTPVVFSCCSPSFPTDDWDWYTYGYQDLGPYPTSLYSLLHSQFASNLCGPDVIPGTTQGGLQIFPSNPTFVCIPTLDNALSAMVSTGDLDAAYSYAYQALDIAGRHAQDIPVLSLVTRTAALREGTGWVNALGSGYDNPFNVYTVHRGSYNQTDPLGRYHFGGGDPTTVRSGQAGGALVTFLNPYSAQFAWEFNILNEVYDTLFNVNPINPTQVFCRVCNNYTPSRDANGNMHYLIELRQNLRWQDDIGGSAANPTTGAAIDAYDLKFSILSQRDFAAVSEISGGFFQADILNVNVLSPTLLDLTMRGEGIAQLSSLATVYLVPRHIWELAGDNTYGQGVGTIDPAKLDPSYDDVASGTFIGSGPFECKSLFSQDLGRLGTGCVVNSDGTRGGQAIDPGGILHLTKFDNTHMSGNTDPYLQWFRSNNPGWGTGSGTAAQSGQFQEFSWADKYDNATVTIQDLLSVAACFGKSSPTGCADYSYWLRPSLHPGSPTTITTELAIVASHMDDTWIYPFSWNGIQWQQKGGTLENIVPFTS